MTCAPTVVGITGTVGKTTCKDMTAAVLSARFRTHKSEGNLNSREGMPWRSSACNATTTSPCSDGDGQPGEIVELCGSRDRRSGSCSTSADARLSSAASRRLRKRSSRCRAGCRGRHGHPERGRPSNRPGLRTPLPRDRLWQHEPAGVTPLEQCEDRGPERPAVLAVARVEEARVDSPSPANTPFRAWSPRWLSDGAGDVTVRNGEGGARGRDDRACAYLPGSMARPSSTTATTHPASLKGALSCGSRRAQMPAPADRTHRADGGARRLQAEEHRKAGKVAASCCGSWSPSAGPAPRGGCRARPAPGRALVRDEGGGRGRGRAGAAEDTIVLV
jgi:hypothetical protein